MKRGIAVPNVGDPGALIDLARDADAAGWDGYFLWDHVQIYASAEFEVVDPWMVLAAAALATERVSLGPMVTAPSRRRPWQLAKQIVTLDHLSRGRAMVGVGLGFPVEDEFGAFGEVTELRRRAERTDEALDIIDQVLRGAPVDHAGEDFEVHAHLLPPAVQTPRPPILIAATPPHRKPLQRAARWDGVVVNLKLDDDLMPPRPEELRAYVGDFLDDPERTVVTTRHPEHVPADYEAVGVSWLLEGSWPGPDWIAGLRAALELD